MAYIHLFQRPAGDLILPTIPGRKVVSARMLASGEPVKFQQTATQLTLSIPGKDGIEGDLVAVLTMSDSLDVLAGDVR